MMVNDYTSCAHMGAGALQASVVRLGDSFVRLGDNLHGRLTCALDGRTELCSCLLMQILTSTHCKVVTLIMLLHVSKRKAES